MRVGLVSPIWHGEHFNPGWDQITDGIRYLVRRVVPEAVFVPVEMMRDIPEHWEAAATCDAVILCGNPRFSMFGPSFWECDVWYRLAGLQAAGIRVIDGWSGASHPLDAALDVDGMAAALMSFPRTAHFLKIAAKAYRRITRDALMQRIYERAGISSTLLPCSSWYAIKEHGIGPGERLYNAVAVYGMDAGAEAIGKMIEQAGTSPRVIASTFDDYKWTQARGIKAELIPDSESMLRVFAQCKRVASMRLHGSIPAASLNCEVGSVAIDSRALALEPFALPSTPLDRIADEPIKFAKATPPNDAAVLATLKDALC